MRKFKLSDAVSKEFELVGTTAGKFNFPRYGEIDLCTLTVEDCNALINAGFPYLIKKAKEKPAKPPKEK